MDRLPLRGTKGNLEVRSCFQRQRQRVLHNGYCLECWSLQAGDWNGGPVTAPLLAQGTVAPGISQGSDHHRSGATKDYTSPSIARVSDLGSPGGVDRACWACRRDGRDAPKQFAKREGRRRGRSPRTLCCCCCCFFIIFLLFLPTLHTSTKVYSLLRYHIHQLLVSGSKLCFWSITDQIDHSSSIIPLKELKGFTACQILFSVAV